MVRYENIREVKVSDAVLGQLSLWSASSFVIVSGVCVAFFAPVLLRDLDKLASFCYICLDWLARGLLSI